MSSVKEGKFTILVHPEKCTGCLVCELRCAQRFHKVASPLLGAIRIEGNATGRIGSVIRFTEQCDNCGLCARNCSYGALELMNREVRV